MSNEAVLMREVVLPVSFTCDETVGFLKGTLLALADPNTCIASSAINDKIAGVAAQEKIAGNGQNKIAVYDGGDFRFTCSGTVNVGDPVGSYSRAAGENFVYTLSGVANLSGVCCVGIAKEEASTGETLRVELKPQILVTA